MTIRESTSVIKPARQLAGFILLWLQPVECAGVSQQRNGGVRNRKPPAMRVMYQTVIQKNHLSVIIRLFKPIYSERKGDFNGQKGKQFSTHQMVV